MQYVRVRQAENLEIIEGPGPLPQSFMNVSGFHKLSQEELARFGWYPFDDSSAVQLAGSAAIWRPAMVDGVVKVEGVKESDSDTAKLADERRNALARLADERKRRILLGVEVEGHRFATDTESLQAMQLASAQPVADWRLPGGTFIALSPEQMARILQAANDYRQACFSAERRIAAQLQSATSLAALQEVRAEGEWP